VGRRLTDRVVAVRAASTIGHVANVSYLRTPSKPRSPSPAYGGSQSSGKRHRGRYFAAGIVVLLICVAAAGAIVFASAKASLTAGAGNLGKVGMPLGGGTIESVRAVHGVNNRETDIKVNVRNGKIVPSGTVPAGEQIHVTVVVRRPGWISWLAGKTQTLTLTVTTPRAGVRTKFVTLSKSGTMRVRFTHPVRVVSYGPSPKKMTRHVLSAPKRALVIPHGSSAGTMYMAVTAQGWETSPSTAVSWFPAGTKASAVADPAPGATITSDTPITLTFSKPVSQVLGSHLPAVQGSSGGTWRTISSHAIRYVPSGYGYGLDQRVSIPLPSGVRLAGATVTGASSTGTWNVPAGSNTELNFILANLGYLPMTVSYAGQQPANTYAAQEAAAVDPPKATMGWQYSNTPTGLTSQWEGANESDAAVMTQGAIMMFEDQHDMTTDGIAGPSVWKALIDAQIKGERNSFGYTFVSVTKGSPESLELWHSGTMKLSGIPVNTGVAGADTADGTFAVFEHVPVTTMSGTNVDGSHYTDPGIKWVSYFNGGDALHEYPRGSYGFPQSNGCVEMNDPDASSVYPYTPIGTLVQVNE
jgi:lipoprotein-anchoring transpeptidase ErfK/SrfK